MFDDPNVVLHCEKIDKIYPGTKALDQVSFDLLKGKVNVLIGENGAGKSTLMKMIAGIEQPSAGKMYMDGQEVYFKDTNAARAKGIGIIHQELSLFPNMTVYQNIFWDMRKRKAFSWMTRPIQRVRKKSCSVWNMKFHRKPWSETFV